MRFRGGPLACVGHSLMKYVTLLCRYFSSHLSCCAYPAVPVFFRALTLILLYTYPAVPFFFFALNPSKLSKLLEQLGQTPSRSHQNFTPAHLQNASRAPYLHVCTPAARPQNLPSSHSSTPTRPQRASQASELRTSASTSTRPQSASQAPELHTSMLLHLHSFVSGHRRASARVTLPPYLHACNAPPEFYNSLTPRPHTYITPPELYSSRPTRLQRPPELQSSIPLHPRAQGASRAPQLHTSMPRRLHACSAPPDNPSFISPHLHAYSTPLGLSSSIPLRLHACSAPP